MMRLYCVLMLILTMCAQTTWADTPRDFDIPGQDLATALETFAKQADKEVLFDRMQTHGKQSNAIKGVLAPASALESLTRDSGLGIRQVNDRTFIVGEPPATPESAGSGPQTNGSVALEEIIVTASKRAERLKDVPSSVTALAGDRLLQQGATKLEDYAARVPGLTVENLSVAGGLNHLSLRGINTGFTGNPTVGFYVDDAPVGASGGVGSSVLAPDLDPADIERVEVLRGPQGTLYGAGSMGGLIKYVTRSPSTTEFSSRIQADLISAKGGDTGYALRGAANVPLSETVAIRVNGYTREDPGFIDDPTHHDRNVNDNHFAGGRASLLWKPDEATSLRLSATIQHQSNDGSGTIDVDSFTFQPLAGDLEHSHPPGADRLDTTLKLFDLRVTHDFGWAELMSASSYQQSRFDTNVDYTPTVSGLLPIFYGIDGGGFVYTVNDLDKFTQELRLTSPSENKLFWQIGALYTEERAHAAQGFTAVDTTTGAVLSLSEELYDSVVDSKYRETAAFATVGYRFTDRFDVAVGGRFSGNKQHANERDSGLLASSPGGRSKSDDTAFTFLINPRYRVNDQLMVYGRIASGYRPGGPNLMGDGAPPTFGSDRLINYELGLKGDFFDKTLSLDVSAFFIDWKDIQLTQLTPNGFGYFANAARARSRGMEASVVLRPVRGLQIAANGTYLDAYLARDLVAPLSAVGSEGDRLPSSPRWAGSLNVDYDFALSQEWDAFVGSSWRYTGERRGDFATIFSFGVPRPSLPSYDAIDLRAGITHAQWTLSAYAKNIADKRGYVAAFSQGGVTAISLTQPRTFGFSLSAQF